jgi:hypothetical protein
MASNMSVSSPRTPSSVLFCPAEDKSSESSPIAEDLTANRCGLDADSSMCWRLLETSELTASQTAVDSNKATVLENK